MTDLAEMLSFLTDYDFLNLGWGPLRLAALYGGIILAVLIVVVLVIVVANKNRKAKADKEAEEAKKRIEEDVFDEKRLAKWSEKMPNSTKLLKYWDKMNDEQQQTIGQLSRDHNWAFEYMKQCGTNTDSYKAFMLLWEYQEEKKEDLLKQMLRELGDLHIEQSLAAVKLIKDTHDERIVPLLLLALLKMDKYPPARVADALSAFGGVSGRALTSLYHKVEDEKYKIIIIDALAQLGKQCPLGVIKEAMLDPSEDLRKKAAEAVGLIRPANGLILLRPLLADSVGRVRAAAAAAASSIGGEEAYALLRQLLEKDPDWQVKSTCQGFITSWENAIQRRAEFDEVDEWLAANTAEYNENKKQA